MDARYESLAQEISNEIIHFTNKYIQDNLDDIVLDEELCENIKKIAELIYFHADMLIDVEHIISKKNLLSIDTVFLPYVQDSRIKKKSEDMQLIDQINLIIANRESEENAEFYQNIIKILTR